MLSVANKPFMLSAVVLNVIMMSVVAPATTVYTSLGCGIDIYGLLLPWILGQYNPGARTTNPFTTVIGPVL